MAIRNTEDAWNSKYETYKRNYTEKANKQAMEDILSREEFQRAYEVAYEAGSKNAQYDILMGQRLITREQAQDLARKYGGKWQDFMNPDLSGYIGKESSLQRLTKEGKLKTYYFKMNKANAWFAWMVDHGMREEAEMFHGY